MKQVSAETYNIAWFKLAECVSRREKERALGVYRLLVHSIDDKAFAKQLEGDLYLSFNDKDTAQKKYRDAAQLYQQSQQYLQAAAIFEHLIAIDPESDFYRSSLVELYGELGVAAKVKKYSE